MKINSKSLLLSVLIIAGCSKSKTPNPNGGGSTNNPKLQIVSGNNQSAVIGSPAADVIKVKITGNTLSSQNYNVEYRGSGCNADLPWVASFLTDNTAQYIYHLAGNIGSQTLQATLVETGSKKRLDSVTFNLTGIDMPANGYPSACTPIGDAVTFCKNASGRVFATFSSPTALRYSDDDGISWFPVKSLGSNHTFYGIKSDGKNHMMLFAIGEGIYYSADGGQTWELRPNTPFKNQELRDMNYSSLGTMFFSTEVQTLYYSENNGTSWVQISPPKGTGYSEPSQAPNGDFYVFAVDDGLYRSQDKGITWKRLPDLSGNGQRDGMFAFYLDNSNGWLYKAIQIPQNDIYVSSDNGVSFHSLGLSGSVLPRFIRVYNNSLYLSDDDEAYKFGSDKQLTRLFPITYRKYGNYMIVADNGNFICEDSSIIHVVK